MFTAVDTGRLHAATLRSFLLSERQCLSKMVACQIQSYIPRSTPKTLAKKSQHFEFRSVNYLTDPQTMKLYKSIDGNRLDLHSKDFCESAREKREGYVETYLAHEVSAKIHKPFPPSCKVLPLFVNHAERDKFPAVENMTIQGIKQAVDGNLQIVVDDNVKEVMECLWLETTRKSRPLT